MLIIAYIKSFFNEYNDSCNCHPHYITEYLESEVVPLFSKDQDIMAKKMAKIKFQHQQQDVQFIVVDKDNLSHLENTINDIDGVQTNNIVGYIDDAYSEYNTDHLDSLFELYNDELTQLKNKQKELEAKHRQEVAKKEAEKVEVEKQQQLENKKIQLARLAAELGVQIDTAKT